MSQQSTTNSAHGSPPATPWSPLLVGFITLFLPAGGIVLAIRNLHRLGQVEARVATHLVWATVAIFTVGYATLTLTAPRGADGVPRLDSNAVAFLAAALGMAAYLTLRQPFRLWRSRSSSRSANALPAIGTALVYQAIVVVGVVILVLLIGPATGLDSLWMRS